MPDQTGKAWHAMGVENVLDSLSTDGERGLSSEEARSRALVFGPNSVRREKTKGALDIFLMQFRNVLIVILLVAIAISAALGEAVDAVVIALIVLLASFIGFVQDYRAERVFEALERRLRAASTVVRDGAQRTVPSEGLVPGDLVLLEAGTRVPADLRLIHTTAMQADESSLTGESVPVAKSAMPVPEAAAVEERADMAFAGTLVSSGRARGVVVSTGGSTEFGKIVTETMRVQEEETPLERQIDSVGRSFGLLALAVISVVGVVDVAREALAGTLTVSDVLDIFLFGVALAVAAVPEALPAIVTGTLAIGMRILAKNNALVRRMPAVEALGATEVLCFDKTGTLTKGEMTVTEVYADGSAFQVSGIGYSPSGALLRGGGALASLPRPLLLLGTVAMLCNDSTVKLDEDGRWEVVGDPTEGALITLAGKMGLGTSGRGLDRVAEIPFTSERKMMTTVHALPGAGYVAYVKGAPESVLPLCTNAIEAAGPRTLAETDRQALDSAVAEMSEKGLRVLALATRSFERGHPWDPAVETGLSFLGLVGMEDPLREDAVEAVERAKQAGLRPVMITGDHKSTAVTIARRAGILGPGEGVLTGDQLQGMSEAELAKRVAQTAVYARISPLDKLKIVGAWKEQGRTVAMTGDGVNDAPALKRADVGVAMGVSGTDVAKEAADVVLVDDNFASLVKAVELGRWVYDNIIKSLAYLLQSNLMEIAVLGSISVIVGPLVGLPEGVLPLLPVQILYVNLATDGLPALALGFSPIDSDLLLRPPRKSGAPVFTRELRGLIAATVVVQAPVLVLAFVAALPSGIEAARSRLFLMTIFMELGLALSCRSLSKGLLDARPHRWLVVAVAWEALLILALLQMPQTREALHVALPGPQDAMWIAGGVLLTVATAELAKRLNSRAPRH